MTEWHWDISIALPAIAGLIGVVVGSWLTSRRERAQRRLLFRQQQLREFYSPLLGIRKEIQLRSELRVQIHEAASDVWKRLCADANYSVEALERLRSERSREFKSVIDYDNLQLQEELLPAYRRMVGTFRDNLWLAEKETQAYLGPLIEFIDLWDRWMAKSIPGEVLESLGHGEERLQPFYEHLQAKHNELQDRLIRGAP